jgi:hypothetical protein
LSRCRQKAGEGFTAAAEEDMQRVSSMIGILIGCAAARVVAAQVGAAAVPVTGCVVSIENKVAVTDASRRSCVAVAHFLEPVAPEISYEALAAGPPSEPPLDESKDVFCRFRASVKSGQSLKFRCLRTDGANRLYDDQGNLVPEASGFDSHDVLLDASGQRMLDLHGRPRHGDLLRIKYFIGEYPPERYREMFSETVVSRLFWALGIPVDRVYMPSTVQCFGCNTSPFGQAAAVPGTLPQVFRFASAERRYEGKSISVPKRSGIFRSGALYDYGFGFDEVPKTVELEALGLAMNIVGYFNFASFQNRLICRPAHWDPNTGACNEVIAYVQDVGGALGGPMAFHVKGEATGSRLVHPRADFVTFLHGHVFRDTRTCTLYYSMGGVRQVSEAARLLLADRIKGRLTREYVRLIFEKAKIQHLDKTANDLVAKMDNVQPGPDLDAAVQYLWADEMMKRFNEVLNRRCS